MTPSLCHRCEHRALHLEGKPSPRYECQTNGSVHSCYCFCPVQPPSLAVNEGDNRPFVAGWLLAARSHAVAPSNLGLAVQGTAERFTIYWKPI